MEQKEQNKEVSRKEIKEIIDKFNKEIEENIKLAKQDKSSESENIKDFMMFINETKCKVKEDNQDE